jgi:hypothetical protein
MRISEISKNGQETKKFMDKEVNIIVKMQNGENKTLKYTMSQLINEFVYLRQGMETLNMFSLIMGVEFYKVDPNNKFFKDCDERFLSHLKANKDSGGKMSMQTLIDNLNKAIEEMKIQKPIIEENKEVENGIKEILDLKKKEIETVNAADTKDNTIEFPKKEEIKEN